MKTIETFETVSAKRRIMLHYGAAHHQRHPITRRHALFHLFYQQLRINVPLLAETFILDDDCSVLEDTEYFAHHSYTLHNAHTHSTTNTQ